MPRMSVEAPDVLAQARKLHGFQQVATQEFSRAMVQAIGLSKSDLQAKAPAQSGALRGSIHGEIRFALGEEVRGVMLAEARAPDGFPYGYALDVAYKRRQYRYAGTRRKTRRWFRGVLTRRRKELLQTFSAAVPRILKRLEVAGVTAGGGDAD